MLPRDLAMKNNKKADLRSDPLRFGIFYERNQKNRS